jgi:hypothetical protein
VRRARSMDVILRIYYSKPLENPTSEAQTAIFNRSKENVSVKKVLLFVD